MFILEKNAHFLKKLSILYIYMGSTFKIPQGVFFKKMYYLLLFRMYRHTHTHAKLQTH